MSLLSPFLVPTKEQKRMLEMFRPHITLTIESRGDQPTTTTDCIKRAFRAERRLNQLKKMRQRMFENKRKHGEQSGN